MRVLIWVLRKLLPTWAAAVIKFMYERILIKVGEVALVVALTLTAVQYFSRPVKPVTAPVAVFTPSPAEHETQALIEALQTVAESSATHVSPLQQPAVTVVRDSGMLKGLSDAQIAQILSALKAKMAEKVAVGSKLVGPSPKPYTGPDVELYNADYSATVQALHDTTIKTDVNITRQEVQPSRVGSLITPAGSGIDVGLWRKKQYELDFGAMQVQSHITPALCPQYLIPHTSLAVGVCAYADHGIKPTAGFSVKF